MRRGTPPAYLFGSLIKVIRESKGLTMRQMSPVISASAATVSQVEKGLRALKEPKLQAWAVALGVKQNHLIELWELCQGYVRSGPSWFQYFYEDLSVLHRRIELLMEEMVAKETPIPSFDVSDIAPLKPIKRKRGVSLKTKQLEDLIKSLSGPERARVQGYIEAIIENRT